MTPVFFRAHGRKKPRWSLLLGAVITSATILSPRCGVGAEAIPFVLQMPNAQQIVLKRDHYDVTLLQGWVSSNDRFFRSVVTKKSKLVVSLTAQSRYFDGQTDTFSRVFENTDIARNTDRPWGTSVLILDDVPGDVQSSIELKLAINRDDRLTQLFSAVTAAEPTSVGIDIASWQGYSRVLSAIVNGLVGATDTDYPFIYRGDAKRGAGATSMTEHFLVLVAPAVDGDPFMNEVTAARLVYGDQNQRLMFDGKPLTDHSYAVLAVRKGSAFDIPSLLLESQAAWAVLARAQFMFIPTEAISTRDGLVELSNVLLNQLMTETTLLMAEHRFSMNDRASALSVFGRRCRDEIARRCNALGIQAGECPTGNLDQFIASLPGSLGLTPEEFEPLEFNLQEVATQIRPR